MTYFEHGSHGLVTKIKPLGSDPVTFAYDGLLRRVRMTEGAAVAYFRYDGSNLLEVAESAVWTGLCDASDVVSRAPGAHTVSMGTWTSVRNSSGLSTSPGPFRKISRAPTPSGHR